MDNDYFKSRCDDIDKMSEKELVDYLAALEKEINDPFDDGTDLAGDIALSAFQMRATRRLKKLKKEGKQT
jgi:hypothetical protein